jgi:chorismate mutase
VETTPPSAPHPPTPQRDRADALERLGELRASIDNLDAAIVHLLAERFKCTQKVGALKAAHTMPPSDPAREAQQIERLRRLARDADLDPVFAERFLNFVIEEVIRHHRALAEGASPQALPPAAPSATPHPNGRDRP